MKSRATSGTEPHILGGIEVDLVVGGKKVGEVLAQDVGVTIDYSFVPGYPTVIARDPMDSEQGCPDEVDIKAVRPALQVFLECEETGAALVLNAGSDARPFLTRDQIDELEDVIAERVRRHAEQGVEP